MKKTLLVLHCLFLIGGTVTAQQEYKLAGRVLACYEADFKDAIAVMQIRMVLDSKSNQQEYFATPDIEGNFAFYKVPAGTYGLRANVIGPQENDTTVVVSSEIQDLIFCIDKVYRPAPADSVDAYRRKASEDIAAGSAKIYEWTPWSITRDPFIKINPKVKQKFGYEYKLESCVRQQTREEIVQVKLMQAYNQVVYEHLDKVHGPQWKKKVKHERNKTRQNGIL